MKPMQLHKLIALLVPSKEQLSFSFHSDFNATENLGHTIQVDFKDGSTCISNGKSYASKQFHFHTPSEHLIDGITYPMEMHIVNTLKDSSSANNVSYLAVAILFKMGHENKFIKEFLNKIPDEEGRKNEIQTGSVKLDDLFGEIPKNEMKSYYTYKGSLTTPPYPETVQWVVLKYPIEASEEQIIAIEKMEGNNARHVQALNNRKVNSQ
jgi:carbonic anhydrase